MKHAVLSITIVFNMSLAQAQPPNPYDGSVSMVEFPLNPYDEPGVSKPATDEPVKDDPAADEPGLDAHLNDLPSNPYRRLEAGQPTAGETEIERLGIEIRLPAWLNKPDQVMDAENPPRASSCLDDDLAPAMRDACNPIEPTPAAGPSWSLPRLRPGAWKRLLGAAALFPAAAFLHVTAHEGAHVAAAASYGAVITEFHIGPQKCEKEWGCKWRFGQFSYDDPDRRIDIRKKAFIQAAPLVMDFAVFASTDIILSHYLDDDSPETIVALLSGMLMPLLDFSINALGPGADEITAAAEATGVPVWTWRVIGGALTAVGAWRVLDQSRHLFLAGHRRKSKPQSGIAIFPMMRSTMVGLALTGAL